VFRVKPGVVVLDGGERAALAVVRSLGQAGYPIHVGACSRRSLAGGSRFALTETALPDALATPGDFVESTAALLARTGATVLLPVAEPSALAVLEQRARFGGTVIPLPDVSTFRRICDKVEVLRTAEAIGIATPARHTVADRKGLMQALDGIRFPVVLKPARSVSEEGRTRRKLTVTYALTRSELEGALAQLGRGSFPLMLQERIEGPGVGIFLLRWGGRTRAAFAHRRIREKPPSGGVSVYRESIPLPGDLLARTEELLARFDWEGVAMVEYKVDQRSGTPFLMEINGRFWGSLQLAIDAGVDFPRLLLACALGQCEPEVREYQSHVRSRWWWGDVDHLLIRLRHPSRTLALPVSAPSRLGALGAFLVLWRPGDRNEILRFSDPRPFFRETVEWFRAL
jgi:predicted ATP-grasp superfamily ATP-dependent carboligase